MRLPAFLSLAAVTAVALLIAGILVIGDLRPPEVAGAGERVFPKLVEDAGRIATIAVRRGNDALTIAQADHAWVLRDRNDYPASVDRIRQALMGLAQLEKVAPKTDRPDRYARIGVEDASPTADSTEVTLSDAAGQPIARLLVGHGATSGGISDGLFIRVPGENRSWLARGQLMITPEVREWVDAQIVDLPASDIREAEARRPDGSTLTAFKTAQEDQHFSLRPMPPGKQLKSDDALDFVAGVLARLELEDVKPADQLTFDPKETLKARFTTFDGMIVNADFFEQGDKTWVMLRAAAAPGATPETVAAASALSDRTRAWLYEIPSWKVSPLRRDLAELVEPKTGS